MNVRFALLPILTLLLLLCATPALAQEASPPSPALSPATVATVAEPSTPAASTVPVASPTTAAAASGAVSPAASESPAVAGGSVVRGVFFFSPTCGHCELVITEHLPGFFELAGGEPTIAIDESIDPGEVAFYLMSNGSLQMLMVDVSVDQGARMFVADADRLGIDEAGVPRIDIGDRYFTGSLDIPERLPTIIEAGLAGEGIDWPAIPGLASALAPFPEAGEVPGADGASGDQATLPAESLSIVERVTRDPLGNGIAIAVLIALLASLVLVPLLAMRGTLPSLPAWPVPLLAILGIAVSAYLGIVETNDVSAVCGPVGDCNAVQQSEYARLVGIPIGVLGIIGYALLLGGWIVARLVQGRMSDLITVGIAVGAFLGTLFSAYLTFLEPFVIGATCMWCITSALTMVALLWFLAEPAMAAWRRLRGMPLLPRAA